MPTVYITAPPEAADTIAHALVEARLAACVNLLPCRSVYRWNDAVHEDDEVALLAKTTDAQYDALVSRVGELHPYDVPCIERFDETAILDAYAQWRDDAVSEN
ncbi:divalent-cation tolerance protein CutA [Haladaptatus sp. DJG-WS-42]|uniref:divalent-cation tolerance protein CutA n=1 Tax=Haladaptatus sp. DJG-WS-42 TaxID=3120516 RepID=UPI0030D3A56A